MPVLKVLYTPQPAVARASSAPAATTSENTIKLPLWLDRTFGFITRAFHRLAAFSQQLANILVTLLTPAAMLALAMGLWRVASDLGWTAGPFIVTGGIFSHWQVWITLSVALKLVSSSLIAWGSRTAKFSEEN